MPQATDGPERGPDTADRPRALRPAGAAPAVTPDVHRERYVLACAVITTAAQLLVDVHAAAGSPRSVATAEEQPLLYAAAQARSAAAAMSVAASRLLTVVREHDQYLLPALPMPARPQPGVTMPDPNEADEWRATARALASGLAECEVALRSCRFGSVTDPFEGSLIKLHELATKVVELLHRSQLSK